MDGDSAIARRLTDRRPAIATPDELADLGIPRHTQRRLIGRDWHSVAHGVVAGAPLTDLDALGRAAVATRAGGPQAVASHLTAATVYGLSVASGLPGVLGGRPRDRLLHVTISSDGGIRSQRGVRAHRCELLPGEVSTKDGILITTPLRTLADVLLTQPRLLAIACVEEALRLGLVSEPQLSLIPAMMWCRPGAKRAKLWLGAVRVGTESPLETVSHVRLTDSGLKPTEIQPVVLDAHGRFVARCDFKFVCGDKVVLGEADGRTIHDLPEARYADRLREERLRAMGQEIVRWVWSDIAVSGDEVAARIRRFL